MMNNKQLSDRVKQLEDALLMLDEIRHDLKAAAKKYPAIESLVYEMKKYCMVLFQVPSEEWLGGHGVKR